MSDEDVWTTGSYHEVAPNFLGMAGRLVEAADVGSDGRVLDVACGTGNVAITAARRGARVTGVDVTPELLDRARANAEIAGVGGIDWREGDATALPFEDDAFDATLSNLGHVYGEPAGDAARELLRVTRPGGRIGFTSWTPSSLYSLVGAVLVQYVAPDDVPADTEEPPFLWGDADVVRGRLGDGVDVLTFETDAVAYPALSPAHFWRETKTTSGTFVTALESLGNDERPGLREEMIEAIEPHFDDERNAVELEYRLATGTVAP